MTTQPPATDPAKPVLKTEEEKIRAMLEEIRPYLQRDGGDCEFVSYENRVVNIKLHGACGSCPSSTAGTMKAIENLLREEFNPDLVVEIAQV